MEHKKLENIKAFLYDLDRIRSDADAVHNLIMKYSDISEDTPSESKGLRLQVEIGETDYDSEETRLFFTLDGYTNDFWFHIPDDLHRKRLEKKEGVVICEVSI